MGMGKKTIHWFSFIAIASILLLGTISAGPAAFADDDKNEKIQKLQEKINKLNEKLDNTSEKKAKKIQEKINKLQEKLDKLLEKSGKRISLRDLGILQLAAHDLFNVERTTEIDHENGKLDLSTLFDHGEENISLGGEPRNRENVILFTVSSEFGEKYFDLIEKGKSPEKAKQNVIKQYHKEFKKVYQKTFEEKFPKSMEGSATQTENLAFRTIHDFLPGNIIVGGSEIETLDPSLIGTKLSKKELKQSSSKLDGIFDPEFLNITIVIPGIPPFTISLLERDSSFADQFETFFSFEFFLDELSDGSFDKNDEVMKQIRNLISKGMNF